MQSFIDRRAVLSLKKKQASQDMQKSITQPNSPRKAVVVKKSDKSKSNDAGSSFASGHFGTIADT
jgi:hypothetical protein